ncbi:agglutinin-2 [Cajanus cajan]|uniref:Agglutinin-2 n=1 Tax=Cajanus cajan TaxID=3821 RepID=A0A151TH36_CAJCA|nr:agglutinin-2 [Cajanus cajan]KYP66371.1 Agglutinin-2 [Cajanus cajan]
MAFLNSSKPNLLQSLSPLSTLLIKFLIPFLLLQHHIVKSQFSPALANDESIFFGISLFSKEDPNIILLGNASISGGVLRLTNNDQFGQPVTHSVGRAVHLTPIHLWNRHNGDLADFGAAFSFVVNSKGSTLHGDGFAFFLAPADFHFPKNSSGGYLGLFNPDNAFDPFRNQVVAIEFDSFTNEWDPSSPVQVPHIGIDVGSVKSVAAVPWPSELESPSAIAHASLNYNSESKRLSVFVGYPDNRNATVSALVDLRNILPEWIRVGFSASTGELVETHDILSWSFEATL